MRFATASLALLLAATLSTVSVPASAGDPEMPGTTDTQTVWVKGKDEPELAEKLNRMHAEMAAKGFRFVEMAAYTDGGDVVGMFVTYVRHQGSGPG